jgi:hypothetical protein
MGRYCPVADVGDQKYVGESESTKTISLILLRSLYSSLRVQQLEAQWTKCIENTGDYVEK